MLKLARIIYRLEKYFNKPVFAEWCITNNNNILFYYAEPMADLTSITSGFKQPCVSIPYTVNPYLQLTAKIEEHEKEIKRLKEEELEFQNRVSQIRNKVAALQSLNFFKPVLVSTSVWLNISLMLNHTDNPLLPTSFIESAKASSFGICV